MHMITIILDLGQAYKHVWVKSTLTRTKRDPNDPDNPDDPTRFQRCLYYCINLLVASIVLVHTFSIVLLQLFC